MLPFLQEISFGYIHPLASKTKQKIVLSAGINYLVAENGFGKTTFLDLIERSLCSDAQEERYSSFIHKKASADAFIRGDWVFSEATSITQRLLDSGVRTEVKEGKWNKKKLTKSEYSKFLLKKTGLSLTEVQKVFTAIYYKRENDLDLLGTRVNESLEGIFEVLAKLTQSETEETLSVRGRIRVLQAEVKALKEERLALLQNMDEVNAVFQELEEEGKLNLENQEWSARELERKIEKLHEKIEETRAQMSLVSKDYESTINHLNDVEEELRELIRDYEQQKVDIDFTKQQIERLEKLVSTPIQDDYLSFLKEHPLCPLCQTNLYEKLEERVQTSCPMCNTPWPEVDPAIREDLLHELHGEEIKPDPRIIRDLNALKNELLKDEGDLQRILKRKEEKQQEVHETRTRLVQLARVRRDLEDELDTFMKEIRKLQSRLVEEKSLVESVKKQKQSPILRERVKEIEAMIERKEKEITSLLEELPEKNDVLHVLEEFTKVTKEVFGYSLSLNIATKQVRLIEDEPLRMFSNLSWGEKYLVDMCLRVSIWEYLIRENIASKGLLLIDSPEAALDNERLGLLQRLLEAHSSRINSIVTTRTEWFARKLDGVSLSIRKSGQTSLFTFME